MDYGDILSVRVIVKGRSVWGGWSWKLFTRSWHWLPKRHDDLHLRGVRNIRRLSWLNVLLVWETTKEEKV